MCARSLRSEVLVSGLEKYGRRTTTDSPGRAHFGLRDQDLLCLEHRVLLHLSACDNVSLHYRGSLSLRAHRTTVGGESHALHEKQTSWHRNQTNMDIRSAYRPCLSHQNLKNTVLLNLGEEASGCIHPSSTFSTIYRSSHWQY